MTLPTESECKNIQNPSWVGGSSNSQVVSANLPEKLTPAQNHTLWTRFNCLAHRVLDDWPTVPLLFAAGAAVGLCRHVSLKQGREK